MSDPVIISGPANRGMISLRADLAKPSVANALEGLFGLPVPGVRRIETGEGGAAAWMSPDELLLLLPEGEDPAEAAAQAAALEKRLGRLHSLMLDLSSARVQFALSGPGAREVLAKGAPVDLRPAAFGPGAFRRTRLGQVAAAFWCAGDGFGLVCHRSVSDYTAAWLRNAAAPNSLPVAIRA
ncbi:sarcosine oxidase subunit gamma [Rhodovulum sp. DZ06]|uniref:sarcosine oxidase subunit gamma n=1 Tax=Rhodovulum sp. DZ06 TaxID=3425126 RepID=UPI003D33A257